MEIDAHQACYARRLCRSSSRRDRLASRQVRRLELLVALSIAASALLTSRQQSAWLGGVPAQGDAEACSRRLAAASMFTGAALMSVTSVGVPPAMAEEAKAVTTLPLSSLPTERVQAASNDFSIMVPTTWKTQQDSYPGRLIFSSEPTAGPDGNFAFLQVARLPLPSLLRSAQVAARQSDNSCGNWDEVASGGVAAATQAKWMMEALQKSISVQMGQPLGLTNQILDAQIKSAGSASSGSELRWHALVAVPKNPAGGTGDRMIGLKDDVTAPSQFRISSGKALLRAGVVVLAIVDSPKMRYDPDYAGPGGKQELDQLAQSLELMVPTEKKAQL